MQTAALERFGDQMAEKFSKTSARNLVDQANGLLNSLENSLRVCDERTASLPKAIEKIRSEKCETLISNIYVDGGSNGGGSPTHYGRPVSLAELTSDKRNASDLLFDENGVARPFGAYVARAYAGVRIDIPSSRRSADSMAAVKAAFSVDEARRLKAEISHVASLAHKEVDPLLEDLESVTSSLRWIFSSRQKKNVAEKAFRELDALISSDVMSNARNLVSEVGNLRDVSDALAWTWYESGRTRCEAAIESAAPGSVGASDWPFSSAEAKALTASFAQLKSGLEGRATRPDVLEAYAKDSIKKYMGRSLLNLLRGVPVDELNRKKKGIRIKALKDAGYTTVADVYVASQGQLENVKGIAWSGAFDAKFEAKKIAEEAQAGLKLKLSADDKTPAASDVVKAGYLLKLWLDCGKDRDILFDSVCNMEQSVLGDIMPACKDLAWLFATEGEIERAKSAFDALSAYLQSSEASQIRVLLKNYNALEGLRVTEADAWNAFEVDPIPIINALEEVSPGAFAGDDSLFGLPEDLAREIQDECFFPEGLLCTLRRYQEMGVKYILHQEKTLLGDEMGLGKTVQAIAAMVSLKNTGETHFIVVCPASVLENWSREIKKHSRLSVTKIHGSSRSNAFESWKKTGGVAVTTYETTGKLETKGDIRCGLAVIDEAHYIKNPDAARSRNTLKLIDGARRIVFMTGTALENKVDEMLTLIGYLRPDIAQKAKRLAFMSGASQFRDEIAPVYYRRKREDVLSELPELIESEEWCTLSPQEEEVYERTVLTKSFMAARRVSWNVGDLKNSTKAQRLMEIVHEAEDDGRKALVFTFFLDTAHDIVEMLGSKCVGLINGSVPPAKRQQIVEMFDSSAAGSVLVAQIQSAGTGMNIQSASVVIFCEPQYKPSIESQAVSRAYRMGQSRNVLAYRLLCKSTVDEKIYDLLKKKQAIFDAFADKSSAATAAEKDVAIDKAGMGKIIEEEIERIKAKNPELARKVEMERAASSLRKELQSVKEAKGESAPVKERSLECVCPRCGSACPAGANYCGNCGAKLVENLR